MTISVLPTPPSRTSPGDFSTKADAFIAALPTFVTETNAVAVALNLAATNSTSTTSLTVGTGAKSLTVDAGKSYQPGMSVKIARTASSSNWMHGDVTSYDAGTGALVVNATNTLGSGTFTDWTVTLSAPIIAVTVLPRGYLAGLEMSAAADTDHDITVSAGACKDSTNVADLTLASAITKRIDASWAAGDGNGGLFSGSVANTTWYHMFLIKKDSDGTIDAGWDTSVIAANRPAGYTYFRRIGSVLTDGSANILAFTQNGDTFLWNAIIKDYSGASDTGGTTRTISTPSGVTCEAIVNAVAQGGVADTSVCLYLSPLSSSNIEAGKETSAGVGANFESAGASYPVGAGQIHVFTNTSSQIRTRTSSNCTIRIFTIGWKDRRGRDD